MGILSHEPKFKIDRIVKVKREAVDGSATPNLQFTMDKGRLKALFNVDEQDDDVSQGFHKKTVDQSKVMAFTQATAKKTKKQREDEAAEVKRRQHELETSQALEEYVADFATAPRAKGPMSFVKAGEASFVSKMRTAAAFGDEPRMRSDSPPPLQKPKGKRAMDAFLEEIKRDQAVREHRFSRQPNPHGSSVTSLAAHEAQGGSRDLGDPETSNLFVAHLPEHVTEEKFGEYFGQFGEITSIKIMWPREDFRVVMGNDPSRRAKSSGLSGFVSFKRRKDAEVALRELDGVSWAGSALRVGWSKAVPTSGRVLYGRRNSRSRSPPPRRSHRREPSHSSSRSRSQSSDYEHYKRNDRQRSRDKHDRDRHRRSRSRSQDRSHRRDRRRKSQESHRTPRDERDFIELVATMRRAHGKTFEDSLLEREKGNPQYEFLYDSKSPGGRLYDDLLDPEYSAPEGFNDDGYDVVYSTDNEEVKEAETVSRSKLSPLARKRFKAMLRAMAGKRGEVARCMAFCLEHGEAAGEVSNIVISSLLVNSTAVPRKIARLHLISDIVHNSAVTLPSAWKYRQELQQRLGLVFDHLSTIYHSFSGRMTAETFKRQVVAVVDVWDDRIVFPPDQTLIWKERLDGKEVVKVATVDVVEEVVVQQAPSASKFKLAFKPIADPEGEEDMELDDDDEPPRAETAAEDKAMQVDDEDLDGAPMVDEDVDGEALDEDVDGAPLDDLDGAPLDDVDGEPLDVDGEPF